MSIATEITALNTNLTAAKNAVVTKGGTVGDTGLAGLENEILSIPSGGGGTWGTVTYVDSNNVEHTVTIQSEDEYFSLGHSGSNVYSLTIDNVTFSNTDIIRVDLGNYAEYAPSYFLNNCQNLTTLTGVENLLATSDNFLKQCSKLNCELNFSKLWIAGDYFMPQCSSFNSIISIPKVHNIGRNFMERCTSFAQTLTLGSQLQRLYVGTTQFMWRCDNFTSLVCNCSVYPTDNNSLSTNNSSATMYTTGITLTGTYASDWKTALPDRTSSPYRKLILG